ncbi:hypothetical protein HMPREF9135_2062 [Segatella baroniae F0067]|uniref:Lipocalin-like domain-containing protein n=2 Tax=Segatella baroniae TaxID=305719 RepID=U2NKJ0_9BACT|nr:hypothetical protein HMPREF9135_2062 [Segatella baroniae F0067]
MSHLLYTFAVHFFTTSDCGCAWPKGFQVIIHSIIYNLFNQNNFMRTIYRIPMLMFVLCTQVAIAMAQGTKPKPEVVPAVYGTYEGEATVETVNQTTGQTTPGQKIKVTIEISKGETGFTVVALKDFTMGQYSFDKIPYESCLLYPETDNNRWQIYLESNLYNTFTTKDQKHSIKLGGNIDEDKSFVYKNGTLELDFELTSDYKTMYKYSFKGKKVNNPTGIGWITERKDGKNAVYDLRGRRVEKPGKGIYIVNGKKMVFQ